MAEGAPRLPLTNPWVCALAGGNGSTIFTSNTCSNMSSSLVVQTWALITCPRSIHVSICWCRIHQQLFCTLPFPLTLPSTLPRLSQAVNLSKYPARITAFYFMTFHAGSWRARPLALLLYEVSPPSMAMHGASDMLCQAGGAPASRRNWWWWWWL